MQISYYSALTKIQKLQNFFLKNKKKNFFLYRLVPSVPAGIARNWLIQGRCGRYFFRYETGGVERTRLLAGTVYSGRTGRYGTELTPLIESSQVRKGA